jgi:hypothetical protein
MKAGDTVVYVAHECHWNELDRVGDPVFDLVYVADGSGGAKKGEPVRSRLSLGGVESTLPDGSLRMVSGHVVRPHRPRQPWPATVVDDVQRTPREVTATIEGREQTVTVYDEVKRLLLEIRHPNGFVTLRYPLEGDAAVAHDPTGKQLHSWHKEDEGE